MIEPITGVILAGGNSLRMGQDKALVEISGQTLLKRTVDSLTGIAGELIVVANRRLDLAGITCIPDIWKGRGPLGGIHAGLMASSNPTVFAVACDMPFLSKDLIRYMMGLTGDNDVVVPYVNGEYEPMHACYSRKCLGPIERALVNPRPKIIHFYPEVRVRKVSREEIAPFGDPKTLFFNANTPRQLSKAQAMDGGIRDNPS